jgi:hypothetical protein
VKDAEQAFAVVRTDHFQAADENRVTVKEIVWSLEEAEQEVARLNALNPDKDCSYSWQATRVKRRS